jgi:hypothetical protein
MSIRDDGQGNLSSKQSFLMLHASPDDLLKLVGLDGKGNIRGGEFQKA